MIMKKPVSILEIFHQRPHCAFCKSVCAINVHVLPPNVEGHNGKLSRPDRGSAENKLTILPGRLQRLVLPVFIAFSTSLINVFVVVVIKSFIVLKHSLFSHLYLKPLSLLLPFVFATSLWLG